MFVKALPSAGAGEHNMEEIEKAVESLVHMHGTNDPFLLCQYLHIHLLPSRTPVSMWGIFVYNHLHAIFGYDASAPLERQCGYVAHCTAHYVLHREHGPLVIELDEPGPSALEAEATPESIENKGKLLLDATCTPADIAFPTDLFLLNTAREKLEEMIDVLHVPHCGSAPKPHTYWQKARKQYLAVAKQRRVNHRVLRKAIGQQLRFVARDLRIIAELNEQHGLMALSKQQYKQLLVIHELYRQQREMHEKRSHRIDDRIVSIWQPHVRPIVRGKAKAKANVEFGAKVAISLVDGYALVERLEWDSYNEGNTLQASVEAYLKRYEFYPEAVLADTIYRNRDNLWYCKKLDVRLSGPQLGRPSKTEQAEQKRVAPVRLGRAKRRGRQAGVRTGLDSDASAKDEQDGHRATAVGHEPGEEAAGSFLRHIGLALLSQRQLRCDPGTGLCVGQKWADFR